MLRVKSECRKWRNRMMDEQKEHGEIMLKWEVTGGCEMLSVFGEL